MFKKLVIVLSIFWLLQCDNESGKTYSDFIQTGNYQGEYWPTDAWRTCRPSEVDMDAKELYNAYEYAIQKSFGTHGLVVIKDGYIVGEYYDGNFSKESIFTSYSVAKSFLSALIGIAIGEGTIGDVDDLASLYLQPWHTSTTDSRKKEMTIRHLLSMASGIEWNEDYSDPNNDIMQMVYSGDYLNFMLNKPMENSPNVYWEYNTGNSILLSGILQNATGKSAFTYAQEKLFEPLGINQINWESDNQGLTVGGWGINTTVRNYAKFGYLFLQKGLWENQQIVPDAWTMFSTQPINRNIQYYGLHWWVLKGFGDYDLPDDIFMALGIHGQIIYVMPSQNIVISRFSSNSDPLDSDWNDALFLNYIMESLK